MAKATSSSNAADVIAAIIAASGQSDEESTVTQYLDTGYPPLNHALTYDWDKGFPVGRIVEIFGPESSGKTAIATQAMISAQKQGGYAGFCDHERSFQQYLAEGQGLVSTLDRFMYKKPKTFEDSLAVCLTTSEVIRQKKLISPDAPICWVFDSLASMVPNSAYYDSKTGKKKEFDQRSMHDNTALARATAAHFPAFAQFCDDFQVCAIFLNQIRMNINVTYGNPETTPGGNAPKYYASTRVQLGASKIEKGQGAAKEVIGTKITARTIKNKVARPFSTSKFRFEFKDDGTGYFNIIRSLLEFLIEEKVIPQSGAWVEWEGKKYYPSILSEKLETEADALDKLKAMLPTGYQAPIVAEVETAEVSESSAEA